jgi:hypothetical protein
MRRARYIGTKLPLDELIAVLDCSRIGHAAQFATNRVHGDPNLLALETTDFRYLGIYHKVVRNYERL